jgi:hypothetical protein
LKKNREKKQLKKEKLKKKQGATKLEHRAILDKIHMLEDTLQELNADMIRLRQQKSIPIVSEKIVNVSVEVEKAIVIERRVGQQEIMDLRAKTVNLEHSARLIRRNIEEMSQVLQEKNGLVEFWRSKCNELENNLRRRASAVQSEHETILRDLDKKIRECEEKNRYLETEIGRVNGINKEKNLEVARYIEFLSEKNRDLELNIEPRFRTPFI